MSLYSNRRRPPLRHRSAAAFWYDCSMLPDDETVFLLPLPRDAHHHGGARSRDPTPAAPNFSDQNQRFPHHHLFQDRTVILNLSRRRISGGGRGEGLSEETIAKYIRTRVHHHRRETHQNADDDDDDEDDGVCVVCQDDLLQENGIIATLDCGHDYHANCINKWLNLSNTCPLCKATVLVASSEIL